LIPAFSIYLGGNRLASDHFDFLVKLLKLGVKTPAAELDIDILIMAVGLIDPAHAAELVIITLAAVITQFQVGTLNLPAGQEMVFGGGALVFDAFGAMAHFPAWFLASPETDIGLSYHI